MNLTIQECWNRNKSYEFKNQKYSTHHKMNVLRMKLCLKKTMAYHTIQHFTAFI